MLKDFNTIPAPKTEGYLVMIDPAAKDYLLIKSKDIWQRFKRAMNGSVGSFRERYPLCELHSIADNFKFRWIEGNDDTLRNRIISELIQSDYSLAADGRTRDTSGPFNVYLVSHSLSSRYALFIRKTTTSPVVLSQVMDRLKKSTKPEVIGFLARYANRLGEVNFKISMYPEVFETKEDAKAKVERVTKRRGEDKRLI